MRIPLIGKDNFPLFALLGMTFVGHALAVQPEHTFCNPLNLEYTQQSADPSIIQYKDDYYMVASKSRGYWYSSDLREWTLVPVDTTQMAEIDAFAPTIWEDRGRLYYTANGAGLYYTETPKDPDSWQPASGSGDHPAFDSKNDPMVFRDDDPEQSLRYYYGLGSINAKGDLIPDGDSYLSPNGDLVPHIQIWRTNPSERGWERRWVEVNGQYPLKPLEDRDREENRGLIEGPWMTKRNGIYYLQMGGPGTQWRIYSDGVIMGEEPYGPFTYAPNNPVCHKPSGFIGGAAHGCTYTDPEGNYWRTATAIIGITSNYERRLVSFPTGFDEDDLMFTNTYLGDFPQYLPGTNPGEDPENANLVGWMLLSYKKPALSSTNATPEELSVVFDEDIQTVWSSNSSDSGQWISVDLEQECTINAIQANFFDPIKPQVERTGTRYYQYKVEVSSDGTSWTTLIDKSANTKEGPHDYVALPQPVTARYVKLTAFHMADDHVFCMSDFRIFGNANGADPEVVTEFTVNRHEDERDVTISWTPVGDAVGYVVRWGIAPDKLYNSYQVMHDQNDIQVVDGSELTLWYLNLGTDYYFAIDTFNENGITRGTQAVPTNPADPVVPISDPSPIASASSGSWISF